MNNSFLHKVIIESITKIVKEDKRQLYFPFDGESKPNHLQFIDYLEEIGHYGHLTFSGFNPLKDEETCLMTGQESFYFGYLDESEDFDDYGWDYFISEIKDKYEDELNYELDDPFDLEYCSNEMSDKEYKIYKSELIKKGHEDLYYFIESLNLNNGLIYVERAIEIANVNNGIEGYTDELVYNFSSIGRYWSFAKGGACVYYGGGTPDEDGKKYGTSTIILKGYVDPKDVEWGISIRTPGEEQELRLIHNAEVEIFEIENSDGKKFPLKDNIIVNA